MSKTEMGEGVEKEEHEDETSAGGDGRGGRGLSKREMRGGCGEGRE